MNAHRLFIFIGLMIPTHLIIITEFWMNIKGKTGIEYNWSTAIITTHLTGLAAISLIGILAGILLHKYSQKSPLVTLFQGIICVGYLILGAVICAIDQFIMTNVTAYLIVCVMISAFLNRPYTAALYYIIGVITFFYATAFVQRDPVILLSLRMNALATTVVGLGMSQFLWKNEITNIRQKILIGKQRQELLAKNAQLEVLATHDALTGLLNRAQFDVAVSLETNRMSRSGKEACIVMMDIDYFKNINDQYGHPQGDIVLKEIAQIVKSNLRTIDVAARLGGEEFIIMLPETGLGGGFLVAEKLRQAIQEHVFHLETEDVRITASFGVTELSADVVEPFIVGYKNADNALYCAKRRGRNCVC